MEMRGLVVVRFFAVCLLAILLFSAIAAAQPTILPIGNKVVNEGSLLAFNVSAIFSANSTYNSSNYTAITANTTYFYNTTSPAMKGAVLQASGFSNASFTWTPSFTDAGSYTVTFTVFHNVSNGTPVNAVWNGSASHAITITVNDVPAGMSLTVPVVGGKTQKRSNPKSDRATDENLLVTASATLSNTGIENLTNVNVTSITPSGYSQSEVNLSFISISDLSLATTLNRSQSTTIKFQARIPKDLDAVTGNRLEENKQTVGTIAVTGTTTSGSTVTASSPIQIQTENNLRIKNIKVEVDGDSENVDNGDRVSNVKAGASVVMKIELENKFSRDDNVDINDVDVTVDSDDLDVNEDEDAGDIAPKKTREVTVRFTIDEDADDDDYEVEVRASGEDENGAKHGEFLRFTIEVEKREHEIKIGSVSLNPESAGCEERAQLRATIKNIGRRDEDEVFLRIESPDLRYGDVLGPYELDEDDSRLVTADIPVPKNMSAGNKRITLETYYDTDIRSNSDAALLRVVACDEASRVTTPPATQPPATQPPTEQPPAVREPVVAEPVVISPPAATPEKKEGIDLSSSKYYIPLLIAGNIVLLGAAIFLVAKLAAA